MGVLPSTLIIISFLGRILLGVKLTLSQVRVRAVADNCSGSIATVVALTLGVARDDAVTTILSSSLSHEARAPVIRHRASIERMIKIFLFISFIHLPRIGHYILSYPRLFIKRLVTCMLFEVSISLYIISR